MTQTRLAAACGVVAKNVRRYEAGDQTPSEPTLQALCEALNFPHAFFLKDTEPPAIPLRNASFRSLSTMTQLQAAAVLAAGSIAIELSALLDRQLQLPDVDVPDLRGADPERAAQELRAAWRLGSKSITNMIHLLEAKGVRVFSLVEDCDTVDAFCIVRERIPFVFLSTKKSGEHSRWDAAHELGHLVMHAGRQENGRAVEQCANRFAGALLMPRDDVLAHAPRLANVDAIVRAKRRWGVSAIALARRMHEVGLLREFHYKQLCIEMSHAGYRKNEPAPMPREHSQLLRKAFELLKQKGISRADVARELAITLDELDRLVFRLVMVTIAGKGRSARAARPALRLVPGGKMEPKR